MDLPGKKNIYFLSDAHLGIPTHSKSLAREKLLVSFLDSIKKDASEVCFLGDMFDFWFEYRTVVPKGYTRLFGKIAEMTDAGITVNYFTGNHDMWVFNYFSEELGVKVFRKPVKRTICGKKFIYGHGDGLGPGDAGYKLIKKIFSNKICQKLFAFIHPGFGTGLALYFSRKSRLVNGNSDAVFMGKEKERLIQYCKSVLEHEKTDYFIFGHRHLPMEVELGNGAKYFNTGDWISNFSYIVFDGEKLSLQYYNSKQL